MTSPASEELAERIRTMLADRDDIAEIRMMGGLCFTMNGNMLAGTMKGGDLLARVGADGYDAALKRPGAGPMRFTGRTMKGFVSVDGAALDDAALRDWLSLSMSIVAPMPPKEKKPPAPRAKRAR